MKNSIRNTQYAILIVLILSWLILPQIAEAAIYYVAAEDLNASDSNPGTSEYPWKTLSRALTRYSGAGTKVAEGDTVYFKNGSYGTFTEDSLLGEHEQFYHRSNWITYKAAPGHSPSFDQIYIRNQVGSDQGSSYLIFDGFHITRAGNNVYIFDTTYYQVKNCTIIGTNYELNHYTVDAEGSYGWIEDCNIIGGGQGIRFSGSELTFKGNLVHHISEHAIHGYGSNILIEGNNIYDIDMHYAQADDVNWSTYHTAGMYIGSATPMTIRNNTVHDSNDIQGISVYCTGNGDVQLENNLVYNLNNPASMIIEGTSNCNIINNSVPQGYIRVSTPHGISSVVTNLYNNILSSFIVDGDYGGATARVINHGNNIFGNNPDGQGGTYKFYTDSTELKSTTPTFVDVAKDNYRLAEGSVAINFGNPNYAPSTDILGNGRVGLPDAGCYEYGASTFLYGDVSGNGEVSSYDAALTAQAAVGLITLTPEQIKAADVSGNGEVSAYDAALIAQKAVGLIEKFPVEG